MVRLDIFDDSVRTWDELRGYTKKQDYPREYRIVLLTVYLIYVTVPSRRGARSPNGWSA